MSEDFSLNLIYGTKYTRMDQVKFWLKNFDTMVLWMTNHTSHASRCCGKAMTVPCFYRKCS